MKVFKYYGSNATRRGQLCIVTAKFINTSDCVDFIESFGIEDDEKYMVQFHRGGTINVFGRNLAFFEESELDEDDVAELKQFIEQWEPSKAVAHPYCQVQFPDTPHSHWASGKRYSYVNPGLMLTVGMKVVVEARNFFSVARVCAFPHPESHEAKKATKMVVQVVDTSNIDEIRKKAREQAELDRKIKKRVEHLRKHREIEILAEHDTELAQMLERRNALQ